MTIHTLQDNIEKKKKKTLIINHLIPHLPHFPTYPATLLLSLPVIIARNFQVSALLLFKFICPFSLNLDLILLFSFRLVYVVLVDNLTFLCVLRQSDGASIEESLSSITTLFFYSFFFFSGKGWSWLIALLFQIFTIYSKLLHFGVLSKPANNRFNHPGFRFLRLNRPVSGFSRLLDNFRFLVIIGPK